jgi:hypothetical protein
MNLEERVDKAADVAIASMVSCGVSKIQAREYINKHIIDFVERGVWTHDSIHELKQLSDVWQMYIKGGKQNGCFNLFNKISEAIKPYILSFAERARLELERNEGELSESELVQFQADLLAMQELEAMCCNDQACPVTEEHKNLFNVLVEGLDPNRFDLDKPPVVTKEEIAQFRELAPKFGLTENEIVLYIQKVTSGTPTGYVQRILTHQNIVDERLKKNAQILRNESGNKFWRGNA